MFFTLGEWHTFKIWSRVQLQMIQFSINQTYSLVDPVHHFTWSHSSAGVALKKTPGLFSSTFQVYLCPETILCILLSIQRPWLDRSHTSFLVLWMWVFLGLPLLDQANIPAPWNALFTKMKCPQSTGTFWLKTLKMSPFLKGLFSYNKKQKFLSSWLLALFLFIWCRGGSLEMPKKGLLKARLFVYMLTLLLQGQCPVIFVHRYKVFIFAQ